MTVSGGTVLLNSDLVKTGSSNAGTTAATLALTGGTLDMQGDFRVNYAGVGTTFNNAGTFVKSAGTGSGSVLNAFNNTGTVNVNSGTWTNNDGAITVFGDQRTLIAAVGDTVAIGVANIGRVANREECSNVW